MTMLGTPAMSRSRASTTRFTVRNGSFDAD
jgi:hypothetical protein